MKPIVSIIGRPNVGKSSLFQLLTEKKVSKTQIPTRDRIYNTTTINDIDCILVDTGGIVGKSQDTFEKLGSKQASQALEESNIVLFVIDARVGVTYEDKAIIKIIRKHNVPIVLVANFASQSEPLYEFHELGLKYIWPVVKLNMNAIKELETLIEPITSSFDSLSEYDLSDDEKNDIKIAILGRPNVGKSTLVNRLLKSERTIISDIPGTTLDSIEIPYEHKGKKFTLIDTAGVRKKTKITDRIEQKTIYQSLRSVDIADISICLIDAIEGIVDQDMKLISYVIRLGRPLIIVANKIDVLSVEKRKQLSADIKHQLKYAKYLQVHSISALKGTKINPLMNLVHSTYEQITRKISTSILTKLLYEAIEAHQPPLHNNKRIKLKYAHMGSLNPHIIIIHGTRTKHITSSYTKYLNNYFHEHLGLFGVQFRLIFKEGERNQK